MLRAFVPVLLCVAFAAHAQDAASLRARHAALKQQLADNPFGRAVHVESDISGNSHNGEIYAVLEHPYRVVAPALARAASCSLNAGFMSRKRSTSGIWLGQT